MSNNIGDVITKECEAWCLSFSKLWHSKSGDCMSTLDSIEQLYKMGYLSEKEYINYGRSYLNLASIE